MEESLKMTYLLLDEHFIKAHPQDISGTTALTVIIDHNAKVNVHQLPLPLVAVIFLVFATLVVLMLFGACGDYDACGDCGRNGTVRGAAILEQFWCAAGWCIGRLKTTGQTVLMK